MSNFTDLDLQQGIEAVSQNISELDDQHGKSNEYMLDLTKEVEDRVRQSRAEMAQNRTEYERIMQDYEQAKRFLHSLELLTLKASSHSYRTGIFGDLDAKAKALAPGSSAIEDYAEVDSDHLRLGLKRLLKKNGNGVSKGAEAEEVAT